MAGFNIFDFSTLGGNQLNKAVSNHKLPTVAPYNPGVQPTYSPVQKTTVGGEVKFNGPTTPGIYDKLYNIGTGLADWTAGVVTERATVERQGGMTENQMRAVVKEMRKDKLSDTEIALQLEAIDKQLMSEYKNKQQQAYEQASPVRKLAGGAVNLAAGNLQTIAQYGGNILDAATFGQTGIGEDVSQMMEQNKQIYGDSNAFKAGTYLPDVALAVSPIGAGYIQGGKGALGLAGRSGVVGAGFGATQPILEKGSNASISEIATGGAVGGALGAGLPLAGAGIVKGVKGVGKYISKTLPENLQVSSQFNRSDLTNVSERLAKLTGKEVEVEDAARWLLDRGVKGDLKTQRQQIQSIIAKEEETASKILKSKIGDIGDTNEANNLRKALSEKIDNYIDKDGIPTAGNEGIVARIRAIVDNKSMTLQEMNEGRKILADGLFTKQGTMKELASKEGWQNVWKDTSKFIESKAPGFRATNKNIEVGIAIDKAMLKKETAEQTKAMLAYLGLGGGFGGAGGYAMGGDLESAVKGAAIGFSIGQLSRILNSPKVKSTLAFYLNKLSPEARATMKNLQKGIEVKPENIGKVVEEMREIGIIRQTPSVLGKNGKMVRIKAPQSPVSLEKGSTIQPRPLRSSDFEKGMIEEAKKTEYKKRIDSLMDLAKKRYEDASGNTKYARIQRGKKDFIEDLESNSGIEWSKSTDEGLKKIGIDPDKAIYIHSFYPKYVKGTGIVKDDFLSKMKEAMSYKLRPNKYFATSSFSEHGANFFDKLVKEGYLKRITDTVSQYDEFPTIGIPDPVKKYKTGISSGMNVFELTNKILSYERKIDKEKLFEEAIRGKVVGKPEIYKMFGIK